MSQSLAWKVGLPAGALCGLGCAVAAWKWRTFMAAAGWPASGAELVAEQQLLPYGLALAWRALALPLGVAAAGLLAVAALGRWSGPADAVAGEQSARKPVWPLACAFAVAGFAYGFAHRSLGPIPPVGDEASYVERGHQLWATLGSGDLVAMIHWFDLAGHRPWPGLAPVYAGVGLGLPMPALVGLQAAAAWGIAALGMARLGQTLGARPSAAVVAAGLLLMQPMFRAVSTLGMADGLLYATAMLAFAEASTYVRWPTRAACLRAGVAMAAAVAVKPGGNLWCVAALGLGSAAALAADCEHGPWRSRLARTGDLAAVAVAATVLATLLGGGPKAWYLSSVHAASVEGLGYYDEAIATLAEKCHWLALVPLRLATVPLLVAALAGARRGPRRLVLMAAVALGVPLLVHTFAMESKSLRLIGCALVPLGALALAGIDGGLALAARLRAWPAIACTLLLVAVGARDLATAAPDLQVRNLAGPLRAGDWADARVQWIGWHPVTDFAVQWRPVAQRLAALIAERCDREASVTLFAEPRLVLDGNSGDYAGGLVPHSYYAPDLQFLHTDPLTKKRACLIVHDGHPLYWPGGHGRLHGEGLISELAALAENRRDPLAAAYAEVARLALPDGHWVTLYGRDRDASPLEQAQWGDRMAQWMPKAGALAQFWLDTAQHLAQLGDQRAQACLQLRRAAQSLPMRGVLRCERVLPQLCWAAVEPARRAAKLADDWHCPAVADGQLWPAKPAAL